MSETLKRVFMKTDMAHSNAVDARVTCADLAVLGGLQAKDEWMFGLSKIHVWERPLSAQGNIQTL